MRGMYKCTIGLEDLEFEICHVSTMLLHALLPRNWQYCYIPCLANTRPQLLTLQCPSFLWMTTVLERLLKQSLEIGNLAIIRILNPMKDIQHTWHSRREAWPLKRFCYGTWQQPFLLAIKPDRGGRKTTCWRVWYNTFPSLPPLPSPFWLFIRPPHLKLLFLKLHTFNWR